MQDILVPSHHVLWKACPCLDLVAHSISKTKHVYSIPFPPNKAEKSRIPVWLMSTELLRSLEYCAPLLTSTTATSGARRRLPDSFETVMSGHAQKCHDTPLLGPWLLISTPLRFMGFCGMTMFTTCGSLQIGSLGFMCHLA